jgi:hypothetical protein
MNHNFIKIKINNKNYGAFTGRTIFITPELKDKLERIKTKNGIDLYNNLILKGFQGGKHLIELLIAKYGENFNLILSHNNSSINGKDVIVDYYRFNTITKNKFFSMYREYGLNAAIEFLKQDFPSDFPKDEYKELPSKKESKKVFDNLTEAAEKLSQKDRNKLPNKLIDLINKQNPQFVFDLLQAIDQKNLEENGRLKIALQQIIAKLSKQPDQAMNELSDFMDKWGLLQITSLLSILKSRLETIKTFEEMIHNENTYELRGDKSIHRILEKSMWLLDDKYWIAQSNKSLREFIGKELEKSDKKYERKRPDFACVNSTGDLILIEIKRPSVELKEREINQAELYLRIIKKYKSENKKPIIYLVGKTISSEARELADLRGYPKICTYQDIIDNCRHRYQEYLKIIEDS